MTQATHMPTVEPVRQHLGNALVALQLGLIAALAMLGAPVFLHGKAHAGAWALAAAGTILGVWALSCNRPGNFNIRPTPRTGGRLVQQGPYRWIRHPMYTALIACGSAAAWAAASTWGWLAVAALCAVLAIKAMLEERWMLVEHPGYAAYRARTRRFLPGLL
jgi:protein-S-isoprenylcysteine O-methyltransferase Ste14